MTRDGDAAHPSPSRISSTGNDETLLYPTNILPAVPDLSLPPPPPPSRSRRRHRHPRRGGTIRRRRDDPSRAADAPHTTDPSPRHQEGEIVIRISPRACPDETPRRPRRRGRMKPARPPTASLQGQTLTNKHAADGVRVPNNIENLYVNLSSVFWRGQGEIFFGSVCCSYCIVLCHKRKLERARPMNRRFNKKLRKPPRRHPYNNFIIATYHDTIHHHQLNSLFLRALLALPSTRYEQEKFLGRGSRERRRHRPLRLLRRRRQCPPDGGTGRPPRRRQQQ